MHLPSPTYAASCANEAPDCNPAINSAAPTPTALTPVTSVCLPPTPLRCSALGFIAWPLDRCGVLARYTAESGVYFVSFAELRLRRNSKGRSGCKSPNPGGRGMESCRARQFVTATSGACRSASTFGRAANEPEAGPVPGYLG